MEAAGAGSPAVAARVVIWNENPLTRNFNPGTVAGQKISLEKTKGLATLGQLPLSNASATKIMEFLKMKDQLVATVVTRFPTVYTAVIESSLMNLIHQSPSISLEIVQRGSHTRFGTALADGDAIPAQPWI